MTQITTSVNHGAGQARIRSLIAPPEAQMGKKRRDTTGVGIGKNNNSILVFPGDLSTHYMAFQFYRYGYDIHSVPERVLHNTILLPVPLQLVEAINVNYNEASLGAIGGAMSDLIAKGNSSKINSVASAVGEGASELFGAVKDTISGKKSLSDMLKENNNSLGIASMGFRGGDGAVAAGLNRFFGSAPNPHITTLFQGVGLRSHQFQWKLAPASMDESKELSQIINSMRASMLPERGVGNLTLKYPDECEIYIMGTGVDYMYHFKTAVIKSMSTNFAPDGVLSFFGGTGAPTAVTLDLQLTETSIHTREDYDGGVNFTGAESESKNFEEIAGLNADAELQQEKDLKSSGGKKWYAGLLGNVR
jgi:hypothetical protein